MRKIDSPNKGHFYTAHALYAVKLDTILSQVKSFLNSNHQEVVILHFQHLYDLSNSDYNDLISMIDRIIGREIQGVPYNLHRL